MTRKILGTLLPVAALAGMAVMPARPARIVIVSMQRVTTQSTAAQGWRQQLQVLRDQKTRAIAEKQKQLDATRLDLASSGGILKSGRRAQLAKAVDQQTAELKTLRDQAQAAVRELERKIDGEFRNELNAAVAAAASERDADFVLNADTSVVWARPTADVTDDVVRRLNARPPAK